MAGGDEAGPANRRFDRLKQHAVRWHELLRERCNYTYVCRRLARRWLERDERKVKKHGGAAAERPEERVLNSYVLLQAYVLMAVTGLGYLALTWSTVVLLGGFVTSLGRKDFWCLTVISMIQAARIFDDLKDDLVPNLLSLLYRLLNHQNRISWFDSIARFLRAVSSSEQQRRSFDGRVSLGEHVREILMIPVDLLVLVVMVLYQLGPFVCIVLASWSLRWRDYGITNGDDNKANLMPALDLFYALILLQGAFYLFWFFNDTIAEEIIESVDKRCNIRAKWGRTLIAEYLLDTRVKCAKEPASIKDWNLITYAIGLLDSELPEKYVSGVRMLDMLIRQQEDVRSLLLLSRPKIQKLIDTLGWRSNPNKNREIRELAARVVADLAGDIHLAQFPGAILCISSLLENQPYWNNQHVPNDEMSPQKILPTAVSRNDRLTVAVSQRKEQLHQKDKQGSMNGREVGSCNELILQGLTILEKLASDHNNCREICNTPSLISKVMAPIYSNTMISCIKINAWASIVNGSIKVAHRFIRAPGRTGRRLRREISRNKQAVSNLERILDQGNKALQELQVQALEILTELCLDLSLNFSRDAEENLIKKQLHIFLGDEGGEEPAYVLNPLKATAGRTLALLSANSEINSAFIVRAYDDMVAHVTDSGDAKKNIVGRLTELLGAKMVNTVYRTEAADILENLCTHGKLHPEHVKEILLPKILTTMICSKVEAQIEESVLQQQAASQSNNSSAGNNEGSRENSSSGVDEENRPSSQGNEEQTVTKELQEALLSLILAIYDKMISTDGFAVAFQAKAPGEIFVPKLKTIVEENHQAMPTSLRIIKLCGQIAISMIQRQRNQYTDHFKDQKFVESLSKASEIMSNLESGMLFAGTGYQVKNVRPFLSDLLYDLEKELEVVESVC